MKMLNIYQADLFIKEGCQVIGCGIGKDSFIYLEFNENDERFKTVMKKWQNKEFLNSK